MYVLRYYFAFCQAGFDAEMLTLTRVVFQKSAWKII